MNKKAGFTLIEIIMAVAIAGIIVSIFAVVINSGIGAWVFIKGQRNIMMETRGVMKRMVREIRRTNSADDINAFTSTQYEFDDIDNNRINYQQDGTDLKRNGAVFLSNLASPGGLEFVYLDASGEATALDVAIRTVQITLVVEDGENRVRLRGAAGIRNR